MASITKKFTRVGQSVNGQALTIPVFTVTSGLKGPKVYIQANMHGAEIQGNAVIFKLLERLSELEIKGQITLVPQANPLAVNQKSGEYTLGRFDPVSGENWNRMYFCNIDFIEDFVTEHLNATDSLINELFMKQLKIQLNQAMDNALGLKTGQHLCYTLQSMALEADYVLDLHTGANSSQHLYIPEYAMDSAQQFNIPHTIIIPNHFDGALDEATFVPWCSLSEAFARKGRVIDIKTEAFTVELGSQEKIDMKQAETDAESILSYLSYKEVLVQTVEPKVMTRYACYLKDFKSIYSPEGGLVEYTATHGKVLPAGDTLAQLLQIDRYGSDEVLNDISLDEDVLPILNAASGSVYQGMELYKVFYRFFKLPS